MPKTTARARAYKTLDLHGLDALLHALVEQNYRLIGPRVREGVIVYDDIAGVDDLPAGAFDEQDTATYRLIKTDKPSLFGYTISPQSWKRYLFPPEVKLWQADRTGSSITIGTNSDDPGERTKPFAFIGVRPCEVRAIAIQDRVFINQTYADPVYKSRREDAFILAVNCTRPGKTCFCASMDAGPQVTDGCDLALTEVLDEDRHYFVVEVHSDRGAAIMEGIPQRNTSAEEQKNASGLLHADAHNMRRAVKNKGLRDLLNHSHDHPQWDSVASRCLSCANCTMVCPTCFCSTVEDVTDLSGDHAERWRKWDSCFMLDSSYIFGGSVRATSKSRYRQWLTHKMATWNDQFDSMGCVGCGRCIAWCPAGIDITAEIRAIQESEPADATRKK